MIPNSIVEKMRQQVGQVNRAPSDLEKVRVALARLGVESTGEFASFFRQFKLSGVLSGRTVELLDLCSPTEQIREATDFGQDTFAIREDFLCLTSGEGEGFVLYSKSDQHVYDVTVDELDALEAGEISPTWNSFFDLIEWYLS